ncbi:cell division protein FtsA [bacterium]|nr:cell division protein FtsA [bacterium]MBU1883593.1 cell division protein FtsA [bacterium]
MNKTVLAIDIGSTKVSAIIADISDNGNIQITGSGKAKAQGLKKGSITNIELASKSIRNALADAKRVAGTDIKSAIVSISGAYTKSLNSSGIVNIPHKEISVKEINRVMHTSLYNANVPNEYEVLHALPYNFKVDEQDFIEDPLGMNASRLEVETHIITTQKSNLHNLKKAVRAAGVEVENVILSGYASAIAVLNHDEKELGVAVVDMGGNTCNIVVHSGNSIRYNDFLGVGSNHITNDLSMALHTPLNVAEKVKMNYGSLNAPSNDLIELPIIGDENSTHEVSLEVVHNVIYARVEETLMIIAQSIEKSGLKDHLGAGVVLTGGFSNMEGIRELAVAIFDNMPVRVAQAPEMDGLYDDVRGPQFSAALGLIKYAADNYSHYEIDVNKRMRHHGESPIQDSAVDFNSDDDTHDNSIPVAPDNDIKSKLSKLPNEKERKRDEASVVSKFWNWATQLF